MSNVSDVLRWCFEEVTDKLRTCTRNPRGNLAISPRQTGSWQNSQFWTCSNTNVLSIPFVRTSSGTCTFSVAASTIWNSLLSSSPIVYIPAPILSAITSCKTHYFQWTFQPTWHLPLAPLSRLLLTVVKLYLCNYLLVHLLYCGKEHNGGFSFLKERRELRNPGINQRGVNWWSFSPVKGKPPSGKLNSGWRPQLLWIVLFIQR